MRYLYPFLALVALALFLISSLAGAALLLSIPMVLLGGVLALAAVGHWYIALRLAGRVGDMMAAPFVAGVRLVRALVATDAEPEVRLESFGRGTVPALFAELDQLCYRARTKKIDRVEIGFDATVAVHEWRKQRVIRVGLLALHSFTVDEMRAVLAHEVMHLRLGHSASGRRLAALATGIFRVGREMQRQEFFFLSPFYWTLLLSYRVIDAIALPWWRAEEFDADRWAAKLVGADAMVGALRKLRDMRIAAICLVDLETWCSEHSVAPTHLCEAAALLAQFMSPAARRRLTVQMEGNPLDQDGRTHPPLPLRIAALSRLARVPCPSRRSAADYFGDLRDLEGRLTAVRLSRASRRVSPGEAVAGFLRSQTRDPG